MRCRTILRHHPSRNEPTVAHDVAAPDGEGVIFIGFGVLAMQGDADRNLPPNHARLMHEAIPGSVLHEFAGEGHLLAFDHFEDIGTELHSAVTQP